MIGTRHSSSLLFALLLTACRGDPSPTHVLPSVLITSHADGQRITTGNRHVTVSGTGSHMGSVEVKLNGAAVPATATESSFTADLTLANESNTIEAIATNSDGRASSGVITVVYSFVTFTTFQAASLVLGQASFTNGEANRGGAPAANTLSQPSGNVWVNGDKLYANDFGSNRVLVFNSVPSTHGAPADQVLGQPNFVTVGAGATAAGMHSPMASVIDGGKLLVSDFQNQRVLIFNSIPTTSGAAADVVIGWDNLSTPAAGCAANRLLGPAGIAVAGGRLIVADELASRVLVWNTVPTTSGTPADLVLGQADFVHCATNGGGTTSASTLYYPTAVWSDGNRLGITDLVNNRVLIWNSFPTSNQAPADVVLGQATMSTVAPAAGQSGLSWPISLSSNGNQLFVADYANSRVLVWNTFPSTNGSPADVVLGQGNFTHFKANDDNQDGVTDAAPAARTLGAPGGVALWGNQFFVSDTGNNRLLVYTAQ